MSAVYSNSRIVKNTLLLYVRMGISMLVGLYTSRVVLQALGVEDFGVYNVVGGMVGLFSIISSSLTAAIQRYLTFETGSQDITKLRQVFSTSIVILMGLAFLVAVICEILGYWFLNTHLVIPQGRLYAANWVFQLSLLNFVISLLSVPYGALMIANERMGVYAYIGIFNVFVYLGIAEIVFYSHLDHLILYAVLGFVVIVVCQIIYWLYCYKNFPESHFKFSYFDITTFKSMFFFSGWNFIGATSAILRDQGGDIIINLFCGPSVNAARGIAMQINQKVTQFVSNFTLAVNPQITKSYATGDFEIMIPLIFRSARFSFYLSLFMMFPLFLNMPFILDIWLYEVPEHTCNFGRIILLYSLFETISNPIITAMLATGKIRDYQLIVGGLQMLNLPVSYILLKIGYAPECVFIVAICVSFLCIITRIIMIHKLIPHFKIKFFANDVLTKIVLVLIASVPLPFFSAVIFESDIYRLFVSTFASLICVSLAVLYIGCTKHEREVIVSKVVKKIYGRIGKL